jgi:hypothetical protein
MRAKRSHTVRITALALAGAVNLLFLSLWLLSRAHVAQEPEVMAMLWLPPPLRQASPQLPPVQQPRSRQMRIPAVRAPVPSLSPESSPASAPSSAISMPLIDWYAEGMFAAHQQFKDEMREKPAPSLDSKPGILVLPDKSKLPHKAGDTEHFEGGVVITWVDFRCYFTNQPGAIGFGGTSVRVCKKRGMPERDSEARAAQLQRDVSPEYISRPLPQPDRVTADAELVRD